ncbi:hypothetical protein PLEOSDRAFT_1062181 [Pleurotus ostreatus PC15]|uniref:Methyltransferase type 11 domain-containing protein n=1 Tax=Pleurotus ostreatus (strain PC15) TaxID=1137138 RepID=A0A067NVL8_PLEO1|nr:hypothetical protein PLEOSDRAFT_1062181 [Pleurotus ostreatus PC15]
MSSPNNYTQGFSAAVLASHSSRTAQNSCAYLLPHIKPTDRILDVGCGPGSITVSLAAYVAEGQVIGVDSSKEVVEIANGQAQRPSNCSFAVGDVFNLPFPDGSFDVVHAHQVLLHLPDATRALGEMRRVCRVGGIVACREGDWGSTIVHPGGPIIDQWKAIAEKVFRNAGSEPNGGRMLITWALKAGFAAEKIKFTMGSQTYAGQPAASWWGDSFAKRYSQGEWREKVLGQGLASSIEVDQIGGAWRDWAKDEAAIYSIACGEILCFN